mmetsp:Transcript_49634/g.98535  ORF Transcript_49634/g.98535 Transcript_49634/m.98535 type:complete len:214 (-) Transcript_49634:929-1570(-)
MHCWICLLQSLAASQTWTSSTGKHHSSACMPPNLPPQWPPAWSNTTWPCKPVGRSTRGLLVRWLCYSARCSTLSSRLLQMPYTWQVELRVKVPLGATLTGKSTIWPCTHQCCRQCCSTSCSDPPTQPLRCLTFLTSYAEQPAHAARLCCWPCLLLREHWRAEQVPQLLHFGRRYWLDKPAKQAAGAIYRGVGQTLLYTQHAPVESRQPQQQQQ